MMILAFFALLTTARGEQARRAFDLDLARQPELELPGPVATTSIGPAQRASAKVFVAASGP
jgi:hypothetical protein